MLAAANVATEYGPLQRVAMRYAGDVSRNLDGPDIHPILARQKATSAWAPYSPAKVRTEQNALISVLRERGTEVVLLSEAPGCSTQHYPRDIGFVIDEIFFAARLNHEHRPPEAEALGAAIPNLAQLAAGTIEGGDVMLHNGCVLVGLSEKPLPRGPTHCRPLSPNTASNVRSCPSGSRPTASSTSTITSISSLPALHSSTAAPSIRTKSGSSTSTSTWSTSQTKRHSPVQVNVLAIAPGVVVAAEGSDRIAGELSTGGIEITVDYSEVTRISGSLRCTTLPLLRT